MRRHATRDMGSYPVGQNTVCHAPQGSMPIAATFYPTAWKMAAAPASGDISRPQTGKPPPAHIGLIIRSMNAISSSVR